MISRSSDNFIDWIYVSEDNPEEIFDFVSEECDMIVIDEVQFFDKKIVEVVLKLQSLMKNVVFAGLDRDFRGEPFGSMKELMFCANELTKLYAICPICGDKAYYTQKLINGEPACYDSSIISIEGQNVDESYIPVCFRHHKVPGKE